MRKNALIKLILLACVALSGCASVSSTTPNELASVEAYRQLGFEYLQTGDSQGAKIAFQKALAIVDRHAGSLNGLALTFQSEGDAHLAEEYFQKAIDSAPDSAMIHNNYGAFLFVNERYEEACAQLQRATEDPFYNRRAQAFENLGRCYRKLNRPEAAIHVFERALQIGGHRPLVLVELADLLLDAGESERAIKVYRLFTEQVDNKKYNHFARSLWVGIRISRIQGDASQAATYALILKSLYPNSAEFRLYEEMVR